ncbi:HAD domain-containing protein [Nonomuraea guangzhouensis]|uniref:HAD domain-containing protein n=1 Tax=Nonomuraea guangzhouensis TaxID=1291555 RepID=A0ABW4G6Z7_9ACTN|nr:HAD domain-containing protein [Nonomuraea guangzhouensis]
MTGPTQRPLLFLDVDGPLIPFGAAPGRYPDGNPGVGSNPLLARINPMHGPRLMALSCDLVWATTWMEDANECIAPLLGLPQLPVVTWPEPSDIDEQDERKGMHWKTRALVGWAAGRSFAWVDDEITDIDRKWVCAHHSAPSLLHCVDPRQGLGDPDYAALHEWLHRIGGTPSSLDAR